MDVRGGPAAAGVPRGRRGAGRPERHPPPYGLDPLAANEAAVASVISFDAMCVVPGLPLETSRSGGDLRHWWTNRLEHGGIRGSARVLERLRSTVADLGGPPVRRASPSRAAQVRSWRGGRPPIDEYSECRQTGPSMNQPLPPPLPERKRGLGAKVVYDVLRDEILDLGLAPGSPIDEVQLAERFAMSRTPIREALVRLAGDGLVTTLPNRSTVVSNIDLLNLHPFFDAMTLMYRVTTRLAAQNHRHGDLALIRGRQAEFARAVEEQDALGMIATNRDFHAAIAEAGRNPYYTSLSCRLLDEGRRILRLYYSSFQDRLPHRIVVEHEEMIAAIEARDVEAADRLAKAHADQIVHQIQELFAGDRRQAIAL